ncbi:MAG: carbohydrate ABC transporter permease [bacterium]
MKIKLDLKSKKVIWGYVFISPFIIGGVLLFIVPLIQTLIYSLNKLEFSSAGYSLRYVGFDNYHNIFFVQAEFVRNLVNRIINTLTNIPLVLLFSLFIANLLNQKFRGRFIARIIFFLPVIITAEAVVRLRNQDYLSNVMDMEVAEIEQTANISDSVRTFLTNLQLPESFLEYFIEAVNILPEVINNAAIPIIIFLAGLQSITPSLYEAADIDGATEWEKFWKITFPMISPLILVNIVFLVIDSFFIDIFTGSSAINYGIRAAMGVTHLITVSIILIVVYLLVSRWIIYRE